MIRFLSKIFSFLFKKKVILNYKKFCNRNIIGRALIYFKTEPFNNPFVVQTYKHTNNWEILEMAKILNRLGYIVDVIDRDANIEKINVKDIYDIFIGLGAGNSGKHFARIAKKTTKAIHIFFAAGPEPEYSNELIKERYRYFYDRHPEKNISFRRMIDQVDINEFMYYTDSIFYIGNEFSKQSYEKFKKPMFRIFPSSNPNLNFSIENSKNRSSKRFLYFGGNGNIVKGLDLLIEVFGDLPDCELFICAPTDEEDFNEVYKNVLSDRRNNIHWVGFIGVGSKKFNELTEKCSFVVLPSCSEGTATSVTTCLRKGLIPLVTEAAGIDTDDYGYVIESINIKELRNQILKISSIKYDEMLDRSIKVYESSFKYTQGSFANSFESAILKTLQIFNKIS